MSDAELIEYATGMYSIVNKKWEDCAQDLFKGCCGFSILSGPPILKPDLMIIGANPGFSVNDRAPHVERIWPEKSYLVDADWLLAKRMREMFGAAGAEDILLRTIQTNFLFFKSSSLGRSGLYPWLEISSDIREDLQSFCADLLFGYIALSKPKLIFVLGVDVFDRHATSPSVIMRDGSGKRRLLVEGKINEYPAFGMLHPTGSRVSTADRERLAKWLKGYMATSG